MNDRQLALGIALIAACGVAVAHPGHLGGSLLAGFAHPLLGADHLLSMLAVGVYAAQGKGRARLALPVVFVLAMLGGAAIAALGIAMPWLEQGIAASMIVLGLLLASAVRVHVAAVALLVGVVAVLHGHAHYIEMGHQSIVAYAAGFGAAAGAIQAAGLLLSRWLPGSRAGRRSKRVLGGVVALSGAALLAG
ncbi:MAG: HupE/UreJ family protein [Rhodocyclaceae bacterium]|nr:HupE/UreJ family protein [Rhodocyclaceae bacterium]